MGAIPPFHVRANQRPKRPGSEKPLKAFVRADEYVAQHRVQRLKSSLLRLHALPADSWSTSQFVEASKALLSVSGYSREVHAVPGVTLPRLADDTRFKYYDAYEELSQGITDGEDYLVVTVSEGERVIAFGAATRTLTGSEIKLIDVDECSRRANGVEEIVEITGESFGVGLGHVVVAELIPLLTHPIRVDSTTDPSQYVFQSLGFKNSETERNSCILTL